MKLHDLHHRLARTGSQWRSRAELCLSQCLPRLRSRRFYSYILLVVGATLLLGTAGSYGWMTFRQHQLTSEWQNSTAGHPVRLASNSTPANDSLTLLSIPKIGLQAGILDGVDRKTLLLAPGHLPRTAWPGEPGNAVIAGHRDTFFRRIPDLQTGDEILVSRNRRVYRYVVERRAVVDPTEVAVTKPTLDSRLTLITCYPTYYIGPAPKRMVVVATLQPEIPNSPPRQQ